MLRTAAGRVNAGKLSYTSFEVGPDDYPPFRITAEADRRYADPLASRAAPTVWVARGGKPTPALYGWRVSGFSRSVLVLEPPAADGDGGGETGGGDAAAAALGGVLPGTYYIAVGHPVRSSDKPYQFKLTVTAEGAPAAQPSKTLSGGGSYDGSWLGGRFCGEGTHTDAEGGVWSGRWWCGLRHGAGAAGGGAFSGQWRAGAPPTAAASRGWYAPKRSILRWLPPAVAADDDAEADDGAGVPATFDGRVVGGLRCGEGTLTFDDGDVIRGEWSAGACRATFVRHTAAAPDGAKEGGAVYEGGWKPSETPWKVRDSCVAGKRHGDGSQTRLPGGASYVGEFKEDKFDGSGVLVVPAPADAKDAAAPVAAEASPAAAEAAEAAAAAAPPKFERFEGKFSGTWAECTVSGAKVTIVDKPPEPKARPLVVAEAKAAAAPPPRRKGTRRRRHPKRAWRWRRGRRRRSRRRSRRWRRRCRRTAGGSCAGCATAAAARSSPTEAATSGTGAAASTTGWAS